MKMRTLLVLPLTLWLGGCATMASSPQHMIPIKVVDETKANLCGSDVRESGGLPLSLAPAIIGPIVDSIGQALADASGKDSQVVTTDARYQTYFYNYNPAADVSLLIYSKAHCFTVKSAARASDPAKQPASNANFSLTFSVAASRDRTAFLVQPRYLIYPAALSDRSEAVLTATVDFAGVDGKTFASLAIPLNAKPRAAPYTAADFDGIESAWAVLPPLSDSVKTMMSAYESVQKKIDGDRAILAKPVELKGTPAQRHAALKAHNDLKTTTQKLDETNVAVLDRIKVNTPVSVHVTLTETRTYNEFLAAVGNALKSQKGAITTAATDVLFPKSKTPEETSTQITKVGTYWAARYTFEQKVQAYQIASEADKPAAKAAVIAAKYAALAAAAAASIAIPASDELNGFAN
jgi:hypothetical protein